MGFRPERTIYNLSFSGTTLDGLHIKVGCCTVQEFNELLRAGGSSENGVQVAEANDKMLQLFLNYLVSWDLENPDDGQPTAQTVEACNKHERALIREILNAWQIAMAGVPKASQNGSNSGNDLQERSLGLG